MTANFDSIVCVQAVRCHVVPGVIGSFSFVVLNDTHATSPLNANDEIRTHGERINEENLKGKPQEEMLGKKGGKNLRTSASVPTSPCLEEQMHDRDDRLERFVCLSYRRIF
eukprot:EC122316.1.p1 GENE.EC122316.1~~EC122316.1.p1  ORF type:complete len:111 (-),score=0.23 EC122316.1:79-411(-)